MNSANANFRFILIDTLDPYNTGYFEAKKFLTMFYSFNVASVQQFHKESVYYKIDGV